METVTAGPIPGSGPPPLPPRPAGRPGALVPAIIAVAAVALCTLGGFMLSAVVLPGVTVEGIAVGGQSLKAAEARLRPSLTALVDRPVVLKSPEGSHRIALRQAGFYLDWGATLTRAYAPGHEGPLGKRAAAWWDALRGQQTPLKVVIRWDEKRWNRFSNALHAQYGIKPVNAGWRLEADGTITVTPAAVGRDMAGQVLRQRLIRAAVAPSSGRIVGLPLVVVHPAISTIEAHALGITEVVARYRTHFNHRDENRTANLRLASTAVDQVLLRPGELFSFNRHVGPRIPDSGYREAPVVANGKLVPGIGGGVCQVSSTLYNAVLLANLQIDSRHRHSITSAYVPPGRDATVAYDYFDFRFRNAQDRPVVIDMELGPGWLEARVLGRRVPGERIDLQSEIVETYPPAFEEVPDPTLPAGRRVVKSKGAPGVRVKVWQLFYRDGALVERRLVSQDRYQPLHGVIRVGTGHPPSPAPQYSSLEESTRVQRSGPHR